jgi:hypothetical protein
MKRATITLTNELEVALQQYLASQETPPSLTTVVQVALRDFLQLQKLKERGFREAKGTPRLSAAKKGSGLKDVSSRHDRYVEP